MARVHVGAWRAGYSGIMPTSFLDALDENTFAEMWQQTLEDGGDADVVVAVVEGKVVGHASSGPSRDADARAAEGELYSLNVDPDHWGRGVGRALLAASLAHLEGRAFGTLVLWVVAQNVRARRMYESEGWVVDGVSAEEEFDGAPVAIVRYRLAR